MSVSGAPALSLTIRIHRPRDLALASVLMLGACAAKTEVFTTDLTRQAGLYVVGYTTNDALRHAMEDRLVADLSRQDIRAYPSYRDIADLADTSAADVVAAAGRKQAVGVILVNQATADASASPVQNPARVTPLHPDIQSFYAQSRDEMVDDTSGTQTAFAEVNLFLLDGSTSKLAWSGTTWSFRADGKGTAVSEISQNIAEQIGEARDAFVPSRAFAKPPSD